MENSILQTAAKVNRENEESEKAAQIEALREEMKKAAAELRFEEAAFLRDRIKVMEQTK